jgi:hypothetical protein
MSTSPTTLAKVRITRFALFVIAALAIYYTPQFLFIMFDADNYSGWLPWISLITGFLAIYLVIAGLAEFLHGIRDLFRATD